MDWMKKFKVNQDIFHKTQILDDLLENIEYRYVDQSEDELIQSIILYFTVNDTPLLFPAKSYAVAIIYSLLLNKYFSEKIICSLKDIDLFRGTDKYFTPYNEKNKSIYDSALLYLNNNGLTNIEESTVIQVQKSCLYFHKECLLEGFK